MVDLGSEPWRGIRSGALHSALEELGRLSSELVSSLRSLTWSGTVMAFSGPLPACCRGRAIMGEDRSCHPLSRWRLWGWEQRGGKCLLNPLCPASRPAHPSTLWGPALSPSCSWEGVLDSGHKDSGGDRRWKAVAWQAVLGTWGPEEEVTGSGDSAREAWHHAGAEGWKGKRSSRQLGMSHNYRRKIRPEPGSLCLCLSDHRPYYKATNY